MRLIKTVLVNPPDGVANINEKRYISGNVAHENKKNSKKILLN